jgi:hypothetical protein
MGPDSLRQQSTPFLEYRRRHTGVPPVRAGGSGNWLHTWWRGNTR